MLVLWYFIHFSMFLKCSFCALPMLFLWLFHARFMFRALPLLFILFEALLTLCSSMPFLCSFYILFYAHFKILYSFLCPSYASIWLLLCPAYALFIPFLRSSMPFVCFLSYLMLFVCPSYNLFMPFLCSFLCSFPWPSYAFYANLCSFYAILCSF